MNIEYDNIQIELSESELRALEAILFLHSRKELDKLLEGKFGKTSNTHEMILTISHMRRNVADAVSDIDYKLDRQNR